MHIFLSYAKADTHNLATELAVKLNTQQDISVWLNEETALDLSKSEIDRCDVMVVLISPNINHAPDNSSAGVIDEIVYAQGQRKLIIPVLAQQTELPSEISALEYVDLTQDLEQGTKQLIKKIKQLATQNDLEVLALEQALECAKAEVNRFKTANNELVSQLTQLQREPTQTYLILRGILPKIRNPLEHIGGFSQVLLKELDGPLTELQEQDIQTIHDSSKHALGLINNLLDYVKIKVGKIKLFFDYFDIQFVVETVLKSAEKQFVKPEVQFIVEVDKNIPQAYGDEFRTRQILFELVSNAAKFTEKGSITMQARLIDNSQRQPYIEIAVSDTGRGIAPEDYPLPFQSVTGYDIGLGLILAKTFANLQNSDIWFESELALGSTFYVSIPINPSEDS